jgi:hypothetical protein
LEGVVTEAQPYHTRPELAAEFAQVAENGARLRQEFKPGTDAHERGRRFEQIAAEGIAKLFGPHPVLAGDLDLIEREAVQRVEEACTSKLLTKPAPRRKPSLSRMIKQAEKAAGKRVTSITTPDGATLRFDEPEPTAATNPWLADLKVTKQ